MSNSNWKNPLYKSLAVEAVKKYGKDLLKAEPKDASEYGMTENTPEFWAELMGALSVFESNQNPKVTYTEDFNDAKGKKVISRGLLQISIESANTYLGIFKEPKLTDPQSLHDPATNLKVGVLIMRLQVVKDGVITSDGKPWKGNARYWSPFRKESRKASIKAAMKKVFKQGETVNKYEELYSLAKKEMGIGEVSGKGNNKRIVEYHQKTSLKAKDDATPWCASFINWCLSEMGDKGTNSAAAISFMKWGVELKNPVKGCIVVFSRTGGNHVAIFDHAEGDLIYCLGGNQGNKVSIAAYGKSRLKGYRGFADAGSVVVPTPEKKPTKEQWKAFQRACNDLGANPKLKIDGIFGPLTKRALMEIAKL